MATVWFSMTVPHYTNKLYKDMFWWVWCGIGLHRPLSLTKLNIFAIILDVNSKPGLLVQHSAIWIELALSHFSKMFWKTFPVYWRLLVTVCGWLNINTYGVRMWCLTTSYRCDGQVSTNVCSDFILKYMNNICASHLVFFHSESSEFFGEWLSSSTQ